MRNTDILLVNAATNATSNSAKVDANQLVAVSFVATFSDGATTGTIQIQCSNDVPPAGNQAPFTPTTWVNVPGTTATAAVASGAAVVVYVPPNFVAKWYRISWTRTAGAGTYSVLMNAAGV